MALDGYYVGVDWNNDTFTCFGVEGSHLLNGIVEQVPSIASPLDLPGINKTGFSGSVTITDVVEFSKYGLNQINVITSTATDSGVDLFTGLQFETNEFGSGNYYTVSFWIRFAAGLSPSNMRAIWVVEGGSPTGYFVNFNTNNNNTWQQVTLPPVITAVKTALNLRIQKQGSSATADFDIAGLMLWRSAAPVTVPPAFNTGSPLDQYEHIRKVKRASWFIGARNGNAMCDDSTCEIVVDNSDQLYSEGAVTAISSSVRPGRNIYIHYWTDSGINDAPDTRLYTGKLNNMMATPFKYGENEAVISGTFYVPILKSSEIPAKLYQDMTAPEIIADMLQSFGAPIAIGNMQDDYPYLPYYGDNGLTDVKQTPRLWAEIQQLVEMTRGFFWFGRGGAARFNNRHWTLNPTSSLTVDNTADSIDFIASTQRHINRAIVKLYPRAVSASVVTLWQNETEIKLAPGEELNFYANFTLNGAPVGGENIITPSGSNFEYRGDMPVLTVSGFGQKALINLDNSGNSNESVVTTLVIEGNTVESQQSIEIVKEDASDIATHGPLEMILDLRALQDVRFGGDIAAWELHTRQLWQIEVTAITLSEEADGIHDADYINVGVNSHMRITEDQIGVDFEMYSIIGEEHTVDSESVRHTVTYHLTKPHIDTQYWKLNSGQLSATTRLAL